MLSWRSSGLSLDLVAAIGSVGDRAGGPSAPLAGGSRLGRSSVALRLPFLHAPWVRVGRASCSCFTGALASLLGVRRALLCASVILAVGAVAATTIAASAGHYADGHRIDAVRPATTRSGWSTPRARRRAGPAVPARPSAARTRRSGPRGPARCDSRCWALGSGRGSGGSSRKPTPS